MLQSKKRTTFSHFHFCYWEYFLILFSLHICGLLTNQPRLISNETFFIPSFFLWKKDVFDPW